MSHPDYALFLAAEAQDDFEDTLSYTEQTWGAKQREDYAALLNEAMEAIRKYPHTGHVRVDLPDCYRCFHAGRHFIIYRIEGSSVYVLRILHDRMDASRHVQ